MPIPTDRSTNGPFMMPITDKQKDMGTIVAGKIESGKVRKGMNVLLMPNRLKSEVLAIFMEDNEIQYAKVGDNVRLRLKNVEEDV